MDERKRLIRLPDGRQVSAVEMPYQNHVEHWNEYLLHDGSVLRLKTVVTDIAKLEGEYDAEGNPHYLVHSTQVVSVSPSDRARKPSGEGN